jgi:hypothetical protein
MDYTRSGISQSIYLRAGWLEINSRQEQDFSLLHSVHTDSRAHPATYTMSTEGLFPRDKAAEA